jgi:hypothetical protein
MLANCRQNLVKEISSTFCEMQYKINTKTMQFEICLNAGNKRESLMNVVLGNGEVENVLCQCVEACRCGDRKNGQSLFHFNIIK